MGMTIAIKDFELPPSCYNCNFCIRRRTSDYGYFGMCDLTNEDGLNLYEHSRSEDCPLVEAIPKDEYENRLKTILDEINTQEKWLFQAGYNAYNIDIAFSAIKRALAEKRAEDGNNNL